MTIADMLKEPFLVASFSGAVGGFVGGINSAANNTIRLMSWSRPKGIDPFRTDESSAMRTDESQALQFELGFLGDLLRGGAAGVAIVFFINIAGDRGTMDLTYLIPISLMVGVVSKKALAGMSEAALNKLSSETKDLRAGQGQLQAQQGELQAQVKKLDHINELIQEGERYLKEGEDEKLDPAKRVEKYRSARAVFLEATEFDHGHSKAYLGLGKVLKRLAGETEKPDERKRLCREAIEAASEAIKLDAKYERAYYNRACYKAVMGAPIEDTLNDLKEAIHLYRLNGVLANSDPDFDAIRSDRRFQAIVDGTEAVAASV